MKTILVVDDDKMILRLAAEALKTYGEGFRIKSALNGKQAVQILNSSEVDLVLTDLKMPVMDGYELLSYMSGNHRNIPTIVMTGFGSADIAKKLKQKGVLHYIEKPFEINALREKISDVFEASSKGYIHGFTLANFLQAVEVEQKTTTLKVTSKGRVGFLHLENGELIDAEAEPFGDKLKGEPAALEILCWDDAKIELQGIQKKKRSINSSLMQILLEASKRKDDEGDSPRSREEQLQEAIRLAEGHHFKEAQQMMAEFLKNVDNRRSYKGWLWYSRMIVTMKSIEGALKNAFKLAPTDPEVLDEIKKFNLARKRIKTNQVRRCPFCWLPIEVKTIQCLYCRSHLLVHNQFFKAERNANQDILQQSVERYTKVIGREKNINAYYYLSIAYLNLGHWEEGLNLFHKTVNFAPDRDFFSVQLRTLLNHMASKESAYEEEKPKKEDSFDSGSKSDVSAKKRILVVEDSATTRKVISITLGQKGYEIIEARDGLEALGMLNDGKPDLVLLDIILPKMDGYKILEIIKKNQTFKNIPVIMLTSRDSIMSKLKGKLTGATEYLTKPFEPTKLVKTVEKYLK